MRLLRLRTIFFFSALVIPGCQAFLVLDDEDDAPTDAGTNPDAAPDGALQSVDASDDPAQDAAADTSPEATTPPFCAREPPHTFCSDFENPKPESGWSTTDVEPDAGVLSFSSPGYDSATALRAHGEDVTGKRIAALRYDLPALSPSGATIEVKARVKCPTPTVATHYVHVIGIILENPSLPYRIGVHAVCKYGTGDAGGETKLEVNTSGANTVSNVTMAPIGLEWAQIGLTLNLKGSWTGGESPGTATGYFLTPTAAFLDPRQIASVALAPSSKPGSASGQTYRDVRVGLQFLLDSNAYPVDVYVDDVTIDVK